MESDLNSSLSPLCFQVQVNLAQVKSTSSLLHENAGPLQGMIMIVQFLTRTICKVGWEADSVAGW